MIHLSKWLMTTKFTIKRLARDVFGRNNILKSDGI